MPEIEFSAIDKEGKVTQLMKALVAAKNRGVFVFVLLELDNRTNPKSQDAFFFLRDNGIAVQYDREEDMLEAKFIVIDKEMVITGSSGWTEISLNHTHQIDLMRQSTTYAEKMISFIRNLEYYSNPLDLDFYDQLYIDPTFVNHPNGFRAFFERKRLKRASSLPLFAS